MAGVEPVLTLPGEGEAITDKPERSLRILAGHEKLVVTEMRYSHGEEGPDLHVHRLHTDAFYVLDGEMVFALGPEGDPVTCGAGTFVAAPPMVGHTFRNESGADARFLNFHAPGARFDDYMRARRDGHGDEAARWFDSYDVADLDEPTRPASDGIVRGPGEGERIAMGPSSLIYKCDVRDGDGHLAVMETTVGPDFPGPPPHRHLETVDSFYVLDGALTLLVTGETVEAHANTYAFVPPGNVHTFSNPGEQPVRVLNVMAAAGFEQYLKEAAALMSADAQPDPAALGAIASKYDFEPAA
jgi:mannose-6-phosphate isomerase-like protein (cupin superfamily)